MSSTSARILPSEYTFDNTTPEAATQLQLLAGILDDHTTTVMVDHVLPRLPLRPGWQALDVGSGAGTIATWLADVVTPDGHVTALDRHPQHIPHHPAITVQAADIRTAELPDAAFDLIHARLVLMHLPDRDKICQRLVAALRPGGILMLSEWDCRTPERMLVHTPVPDGREAFDAFQHVLLDLAVANGADLGWADQVPATLNAAGLVDLHSLVHNRLWHGGQPGCLLHASNSRQLSAQLVAAGVSQAHLVTLRQSMNDPGTLAYSYLMYTTIGRRPATTAEATDHTATAAAVCGVIQPAAATPVGTPHPEGAPLCSASTR